MTRREIPAPPRAACRTPRGIVPTVGRRKRAGELAERMVTFRATDDEVARYKAAAEAAGLTLGEWVRAAVEAQLKRKRRA